MGHYTLLVPNTTVHDRDMSFAVVSTAKVIQLCACGNDSFRFLCETAHVSAFDVRVRVPLVDRAIKRDPSQFGAVYVWADQLYQRFETA